MGKFVIDGREFSGNNVSIINGQVIIDGVVQDDTLSGKVRIEVVGRLNHLTTDATVTCQTVEGDIKAGGSVNCSDVGGSITANGSVNCDSVRGSVSAGGSVNCEDVGGSVTAGGSVRRS